ncbi:DUF1501 domain-containing protein [Pseudomarimonas salicorniae]|uniref:DUF1501 domain-containing protein n=1 Tax=Pseudomarimonas salicorniae TaxID=2933270 RepID=A0ABT0GHL2_9GAMM|nr:DUF1501 domain-containing protein [Lysobacter sp. CAU 1642]MCK7594036.1 DUF1501 domain-containing protein [Lysobacter sp. CAU 1642]
MSHLHRRDFLRASLCAAAGSGAFASLWPKLALAAAPMARLKGAGSDYRALVCVNLVGGNDSFSSLVPVNGSHRTAYEASRRGSGTGSHNGQTNPSDLRIASNQLLGLAGIGQDDSDFGLHPQMSGLRDLINSGRAAIVANVGPLVRPVNLQDVRDELQPLPAQLFSHSDQSVLWQTPRADTGQRIGWGGRLADLFHESNANPLLSMNMSISGENVFQAGQTVLPFFLNEQGAETIDHIDTGNGRHWNQRRRDSFTAIMEASYGHPFERAYASRVRTARAAGDELAAALRQDRTVDGEGVETGYADDAYAPFWQAFGLAWQRLDAGRAELPGLAAQLLMVARVMRQRATLQMSRQLFFTQLGDFDTHDSQNAELPELLHELSQSLLAFDQVMRSPAFGLDQHVTTFTSSEFGRTLSNNGDGTDHGWGGHHFVVGGSVEGGRVFGQLPPLGLDGNPLNVGQGRLLPTLAVDQYAATFARWFGLDDTLRNTVFPNLAHMTGSKLAISGPDLGFLRAV